MAGLDKGRDGVSKHVELVVEGKEEDFGVGRAGFAKDRMNFAVRNEEGPMGIAHCSMVVDMDAKRLEDKRNEEMEKEKEIERGMESREEVEEDHSCCECTKRLMQHLRVCSDMGDSPPYSNHNALPLNLVFHFADLAAQLVH